MHEQFEQFRKIHEAQEKAERKTNMIRKLGGAIEEAVKGHFDDVDLRHPEILDKILELHMLLTYEAYPQLEPHKPADQSTEGASDDPKTT